MSRWSTTSLLKLNLSLERRETNSVIDLIFLGMSCAQVLHRIEPDLRQPSDHAPLLVDLPISLENIRFTRKVLKHDSDEENDFLSSVTMGLRALNFSRLDSGRSGPALYSSF